MKGAVQRDFHFSLAQPSAQSRFAPLRFQLSILRMNESARPDECRGIHQRDSLTPSKGRHVLWNGNASETCFARRIAKHRQRPSLCTSRVATSSTNAKERVCDRSFAGARQKARKARGGCVTRTDRRSSSAFVTQGLCSPPPLALFTVSLLGQACRTHGIRSAPPGMALLEETGTERLFSRSSHQRGVEGCPVA